MLAAAGGDPVTAFLKGAFQTQRDVTCTPSVQVERYMQLAYIVYVYEEVRGSRRNDTCTVCLLQAYCLWLPCNLL